LKLLHVVGTRPNFMKMAAIIAAADRWNRTLDTLGAVVAASTLDALGSLPACHLPGDNGDSSHPSDPKPLSPAVAQIRFEQVLVHTGQHYDEKMCQVFFDDLGLPRPNYNLGVGSGSHTRQTASIMLALEPVLEDEMPDLVVIVGDVNSTLAAALVAGKSRIPVAHVEAGLRSRDWEMPEEINRVLVDQLSDLLLTSSDDAEANLIAEGIPAERIHFVGNTMIDTLETHLPKALESSLTGGLALADGGYAVVTLHRPSNVDEREGLHRLVQLLLAIAERLPVVFPVHARTRERLRTFGLESALERNTSVILCDPLGYRDFLSLLAKARLVLTDSGGVQEETTVLAVPCLTLRSTTERPVTITEGTNRLVDPDNIEAAIAAADEILAAPMPGLRRPALWDGHAGDRIARVIAEWAAEGGGRGFKQVREPESVLTALAENKTAGNVEVES
jgi:UDP-N-acetylglucosamine 2-epimerase (non-hydrolysing)